MPSERLDTDGAQKTDALKPYRTPMSAVEENAATSSVAMAPQKVTSESSGKIIEASSHSALTDKIHVLSNSE